MQIPRAVARANRYVTNPIQGLWAGRAPGYAIVEHTGRKSGKSYRTPVSAFHTSDGLAIAVGYGTESDWIKNLQAAGGGTVVHRGTSRAVVNPRIVDRAQAAPLVKSRVFKRLPVEKVLLLSYT